MARLWILGRFSWFLVAYATLAAAGTPGLKCAEEIGDGVAAYRARMADRLVRRYVLGTHPEYNRCRRCRIIDVHYEFNHAGEFAVRFRDPEYPLIVLFARGLIEFQVEPKILSFSTPQSLSMYRRDWFDRYLHDLTFSPHIGTRFPWEWATAEKLGSYWKFEDYSSVPLSKEVLVEEAVREYIFQKDPGYADLGRRQDTIIEAIALNQDTYLFGAVYRDPRYIGPLYIARGKARFPADSPEPKVESFEVVSQARGNFLSFLKENLHGGHPLNLLSKLGRL